jgi:hypothetical protein
MNHPCSLLLMAVLLVTPHTPARADLRRVPADFSSLRQATNASSHADTVLVAEGTYHENIRFIGKAITVCSRYVIDGDTSHISRTIIDGSRPTHPDRGATVMFVDGEDTTSVLCGFTVTGARASDSLTEARRFVRAAGSSSATPGPESLRTSSNEIDVPEVQITDWEAA